MTNFDKETESEFVLDVTNLREQRRPLWMSSLGVDHPADMVGGGGDIWSDRLAPEWPRYYGQELMGEESQAQGQGSEQMSFEGREGFPPKSELTSTVEEAFRYIHPDLQSESSEMQSQSSEESQPEQKKSSGGLNVGADINVGLDIT